LDTSIVVRYLTGDPPELAEKAAQIIDGEEGLQVTDVVLAETAYVLISVYGISRSVVVDHLIAFLQKENISPFALEKGVVGWQIWNTKKENLVKKKSTSG
jgi:predicted nucleic acid-binding protein